MDILTTIFSAYDKLIANLSPTSQALISFIILIFLIWQIYMVFKSGHWIFIAALIICLPGTWPATRQIGFLIWDVIKFLITRAEVLTTH